MTSIEAATNADVDALTDQWIELVDDQRAQGTHILAVENRTAARNVLAQRVAADQVLVARNDEELRGFVTFYAEEGLFAQDATRGIIENVYVRPAYRGAGIGSRLLDAAEAELRDRDADVLAVAAMADNDRARELYADRGYTPHRVVLEKSAENDNHTNQEG